MPENEDIKIDQQMDLRGVVCPMNFVQTKLKLESMQPEEILLVTIDSGEAMKNVPQSVKDDGHKILKVEKIDPEAFRLTIRRK